MNVELGNFRARWEEINARIRGSWDGDIHRAQEKELRNPSENVIWYTDEEHRKIEAAPAEDGSSTLLFLPYPYLTPGGSEPAFPEMYCWDTYFINLALLEHGRVDLVRNHIMNQLFLIERYGMVLNGNRTYYLTRSQTPLLAQSIRRYYKAVEDASVLTMAYPLLKEEYQKYWSAEHHATPNGLATNRDLGDTRIRAELAAEAESLDFTACFEGDIRKCNPIQTNCALVQYARDLEWMALELGWPDEANVWSLLAEERAKKIRELNWDATEGFFFEYQFERAQRLPYRSLCAFWTLWAGVATKVQASQVVKNLGKFEHPYGLAHTDVAYPSPHPEFSWVQWGYPAGWPPDHMMIVDALDAYGFHEAAGRIAYLYLKLIMDEFTRTGKFWERYNVVKGNLDLPRERTPVVPIHGWTTAAFVWLGRRVFEPHTVQKSPAE
jgi:alpha,alpha-trehalase